MHKSRHHRSTFIALACCLLACSDQPPQVDAGTDATLDSQSNDVTSSSSDATQSDDDDTPDLKPSDPRPNGGSCTQDSDCTGGHCFVGDAFPQGYCTQLCANGTCDDADSLCVDSSVGRFCAPRCSRDLDCRDGFRCGAFSSGTDAVCGPIIGKAENDVCATDADCQSQKCENGRCEQTDCTSDVQCNSFDGIENVCDLGNRCVQTCQTQNDCVGGYYCHAENLLTGYCGPEVPAVLNRVLAENPLIPFVCKHPQLDVLDFDINPTTSAYQIVGFTIDNGEVAPIGTSNNGNHRNFASYHTFTSRREPQLVSILLPTGPNDQAFLAPGTTELRTDSNVSEFCYTVFQRDGLGSVLDVTFYFVGTSDVSASTADQSEDFQHTLDGINLYLANANIALGNIRYVDITGDDELLYSHITTRQEVAELVALSYPQGNTLADVMGLNVFIVKNFSFPSGGVGVSQGIPGPIGVHGSSMSGVVLTSEYWGNVYIDASGGPVPGTMVMAALITHEIGHFLGLFHTSEISGRSHDPFTDTPRCIAGACEGQSNIMFPSLFPFYWPDDDAVISPQQSTVIRGNPIVKGSP